MKTILGVAITNKWVYMICKTDKMIYFYLFMQMYGDAALPVCPSNRPDQILFSL